MYSSITHINILTSLLLQHGIRRAVVCPGSQNAPLAHNFCQCQEIHCVSVTDERSAGFVAMGMALQLQQPVVVCVTSGSALLNLLPAVAEAYQQQIPLIVISADRAPDRIGQLDGQTLPQPDALGRFVRCAVNLVQGKEEKASRQHCVRLVNEALLATRHQGGGPVHINVPICETLHDFGTPHLPIERCIRRAGYSKCCIETTHPLIQDFIRAGRPLIVVGQLPRHTAREITPLLRDLGRYCVVLHDCLGAEAFLPVAPNTFRTPTQQTFEPDFILHMGGTLVDKPLNRWLQLQQAPCWVVNRTGELTDVTGSLTGVAQAEDADVLRCLVSLPPKDSTPFLEAWKKRLDSGKLQVAHTTPEWSQALVVHHFETRIAALSIDHTVCYANSSAVRLGNLFATAHRQCNRGVNGIEGCLSTAVGIALAAPEQLTFCVVGDLSFFYDHNALWIRNPGTGLRILLLNNGGGGIFSRFPALQASPAMDRFIMARHSATARGICNSFGIRHLSASCPQELEKALDTLCCPQTNAPILLEVHTNTEEDHRQLSLLCTPKNDITHTSSI